MEIAVASLNTELAAPKIPLQKLQGCQTLKEENSLLLMASQPDANGILISVPSDQLLTLIDLTAAGRMALRKLNGADPDDLEAHTVSQWQWVKDTPTGELYLTLTFGSGGRLDFRLPGAMPAFMLEGLQAAMGRVNVRPAGAALS